MDVKLRVKQEGAAPSIGTAKTSRKRSSDNISGGVDDRVDGVEFVGKRPRKEIDFNLGKMESHLTRALVCAKEGSKGDLETYLRLAKTNAEICGMLQDYEMRAVAIRRQLTIENQRAHDIGKMEYWLTAALESAANGDDITMESNLHIAMSRAQKVNKMPYFEKRRVAIRRRINTERKASYHSLKLEDWLNSALDAAKTGDEANMETHLRLAKRHAEKINRLSNYEKRSVAIKRHLNEANKMEFHSRKMDVWLTYAVSSAREGDKTSMETHLRLARQHSEESNKLSEYEVRAFDVTNTFYASDGMGKISHVKSEAAAGIGIGITKGSSVKNGNVNQTGHSRDDDNDEVVLVGGLRAEEVVAKRVKEAEADGKVVNIN